MFETLIKAQLLDDFIAVWVIGLLCGFSIFVPAVFVFISNKRGND